MINKHINYKIIKILFKKNKWMRNIILIILKKLIYKIKFLKSVWYFDWKNNIKIFI